MSNIKLGSYLTSGHICHFWGLFLSPPRLNFNKYALNLWVGSFNCPVQSCHGYLDLCRQDRVHKIDADVHENKVRPHVHGQYFIDLFDFFVRTGDFPYPLDDLFIGAFSDQQTFCLGCKQNGGCRQYPPDDDGCWRHRQGCR